MLKGGEKLSNKVLVVKSVNRGGIEIFHLKYPVKSYRLCVKPVFHKPFVALNWQSGIIFFEKNVIMLFKFQSVSKFAQVL
jgi:hypothetical protein